jgi:hypothetical protein
MKTPREILLAHHKAAETKLDCIRRNAVRVAADVNRRSALVREFTFAATAFRALTIPFRELIWPCRRTWAGLAAVWVALLAFNLTQAERGQLVAAKSTTSPGELRLALLEQQRLLTELIGPPPLPSPPAEPPRRSNAQPRSERHTRLMMV